MQQTAAHASFTAPTWAACPHAVGAEPTVLDRVCDPGVNLGLWRRPSQTTIEDELSTLHAASLPDVRCRTTPASFDDDLREILVHQRLDPAAFQHWRADMARLAERYFRVSD